MAQTKEIVTVPAMQTGGRVQAIVPQNWQDAVGMAGAFVRAGMVPKHFEGSVEKATVAIVAGLEVGLTPMAALQSIAVINNSPTIYGDGLVALVRASGYLEDMQEGITLDKNGVPELAWCKVKRKGEKSWKEKSLTQAECVRAGWWKKAGPWTLTPGRMMSIRVRGWLFRDMFADVLRGLHSAEEVQDMVDITPAAPAATAPPEPQRTDFVDKPADTSAAAEPGAVAADKPKDVTDVADENAPITFEVYKRAGDFFVFSDAWLDDPKRTVSEVQQWELFYRDYIAERAKSPNNAVKEAIADTLAKYSAVLNRGREPGEEG